MFDFDPDSFEDYIEDAAEEHFEDLPEIEIEAEIEDDSIVEEAIIAGAIFGIGIEEGQTEREIAEETYREFDEFENERKKCVSLKERKGGGIKKKLRPFEQWAKDVTFGKKDLYDD